MDAVKFVVAAALVVTAGYLGHAAVTMSALEVALRIALFVVAIGLGAAGFWAASRQS